MQPWVPSGLMSTQVSGQKRAPDMAAYCAASQPTSQPASKLEGEPPHAYLTSSLPLVAPSLLRPTLYICGMRARAS